ncbi:MAG TPA: hypothetical protein VMF87_17990 [Streptosporangiaceae bacterium]|nr:hypothetical protein [Streptosporangiaceae bacterium]
MHLTNKTSTITVAVVAALVALAIAAHASGALTFSPSRTAGQGTAQGAVATGHGARGGKSGSGLSGGQAGPGSGGANSSGSGGGAGGNGGSETGGSGSGGGSGGGTGTGGSASGGASNGGGSSSGVGSSPVGSGAGPHLLIPTFPHTPHTIVTAIPSPSGTIGDPGVPCLQGYVWRQAFAGDYVCVTPGNRAQAAADNADALSRVQPGGGAYGTYTCQQGYVWRQVVPDDYVCVTPAVRTQAAYDNSEANNRVALLSLWMSDWTPPSSPPQQNCSGGVCTTTSGGWDGPNFQINGDHFNFGPVLLQIRGSNGTVLWSQTVNATSYPGFPGAALYAQTQIGDCSGVPGTTDNDYAIAYDAVSHRWSNSVPIDSDCASF